MDKKILELQKVSGKQSLLYTIGEHTVNISFQFENLIVISKTLK